MSGYGQAPYGAFPCGMATTPTLVWAWAPFPGDNLRRVDTVQFNVTNDSWVVVDTIIRVVLSSGDREIVWSDATGFAERYRRGSARVLMPSGHHYVLRRTGGWAGAVIEIDVQATDLAGNLVSGQSS